MHISLIWHKNNLGYLSESFQEQIKSMDKYPSILVVKFCVYYPSNIFCNTLDLKTFTYSVPSEMMLTFKCFLVQLYPQGIKMLS